jgi:predicted glycosyltransferase
MYSHDTQGLGHIRRNLLIARALAGRDRNPTILMLSGIHETAAFDFPEGVDCFTLPSLGKDTRGGYYPRSLAITMEELIRLRSEAILAAVRSFQPDLFIADKVPLGAFSELVPALKAFASHGRTRAVLGLREVLDDPQTVAREWRTGGYEAAIRRYYDRIWIYGDRGVYDAGAEYGFAPDIAAKVRYTGYLNPLEGWAGADHRTDADPQVLGELGLPAGRLVLCVVGGGRDGVPLAEAFLRATLPPETGGLLITGPLMPTAAQAILRNLASRHPCMRVRQFVTDPLQYMRLADRIIAMGGYNTMCEVVACGKPALIVPRVEPRIEQLIRAERFAARKLVQMLCPGELSAGAVSAWLSRDWRPAARGTEVVDFSGLSRLPELAREVLELAPHQEESVHAAG